MQTENILIDWKVHTEVDEIEDYIEKFRIIVWDEAFNFLFRKSGGYSRCSSWESQLLAKKAEKRLVYQYQSYSLLLGLFCASVFHAFRCRGSFQFRLFFSFKNRSFLVY